MEENIFVGNSIAGIETKDSKILSIYDPPPLSMFLHSAIQSSISTAKDR